MLSAAHRSLFAIDHCLNQHRTEEINVDLDTDNAICVDISDALSERDKVKYTVHTKTRLPGMRPETSVVREHEEFLWLHSVLDENESYAGFIVPPAPPHPDFESSREKLQKLGEGEATMTKEEFLKMKQELEQDYLAQFKKTVAMHEVFLQRIAAHAVFRQDTNFRIFLQYEDELTRRSPNPRNAYIFDDGRCSVRRLVRDGLSNFFLDFITCPRCGSKMRITQRHSKYKGEPRSYWTYRCLGCQSYRSLTSAQNQAPSYGLPKIVLYNSRNEWKQEQKPLTLKRAAPEEAPPQEQPAAPQESGFVIYIPRALTPEEIKIVRLAFFKILTNQYDEERDLPALRQLRGSG
ncbi:PX domain protein [Oesophagostomum dentatum]|uniref:PX domain protein n=1 Tax=Oesophagostomum dentatum TaxID=61180 RepID=A0A0B1T1P4_OESDE|nr:PX domain protein [Oesophagostomum dentatum]